MIACMKFETSFWTKTLLHLELLVSVKMISESKPDFFCQDWKLHVHIMIGQGKGQWSCKNEMLVLVYLSSGHSYNIVTKNNLGIFIKTML